MADIIRALTEAVDKIGLLAVLIICIVAGAAYIVIWNRKLVNSMTNMSEQVTKLGTETITRNTVASNSNTESNFKVVVTLEKVVDSVERMIEAWGSDPMKMCKADKWAAEVESRAAKVGMTPERFQELVDVLKDIRKQGKDAAQELKDKAILIAIDKDNIKPDQPIAKPAEEKS